VETELSYPSRLDSLASNSITRFKLAVIVSPKIESISLDVSSKFLRASISACEKERTIFNFGSSQRIKELVLEEDSTYCNIPLAKWNERTQYITHELVTGIGVAIDFPDHAMFEGPREPPPFKLEKDADVDGAVQFIEKNISTSVGPSTTAYSSTALPWIAGIAGAAGGLGTAGAIFVSSIKVGIKGIFVSTTPFGPVGIGSATVTGVMGASASMTVAGLTVGAGVAAAVYFIPWRKLASWFIDAFSHFMDFLKSIWQKIQNAPTVLKKILLSILDLLKTLGSGATGLAARGVSSAVRMFSGSGARPNQSLHFA
jgi:hypothetical protein